MVLVDEMHDMNAASFRVLRELLDSTPCQFCGVGDRDQVIYGAHLKVIEGQKVEAGATLAEWDPFAVPILT